KQKEARRADGNAAQANSQKRRADRKAAEAAREANVAEARRKDAVTARGRAIEQQQIAVAARDEALKQIQAAESQREENRRRLVRLNVDKGWRLMDGGDLFGALPYLSEAHRLDREKYLPERAHRLRLAAVLRQCPKLVHLWFHKSGVCHAELSRDG